MVPKVVLAAALLCLAQGQYIFNDPTKVVKELQPKVDELLKNVEIQINEVDKSIQSTSKYIDLKIEDANNAVATKLKLLQQETSESQQLEKNIDACMQNHIMAIQSGNVAVLNIIKEEGNWAIYDNQFTELKNLVIQVKVIASNCIGQSQMDSIKTRSCMEERIAAIEKQATKIHGYVVSSMSMVKESLGKAIQVRVLNIFDDIFKISSEFNACVEQSPTLTIESVIDSKKVEINSLKEAIQAASNEWTKQIADAYKNVNAKVKAADISIDTQVKSLKVVGGDLTLNSCISEHTNALNNLDKSELDQCRVQSDLQHASNEIINLPKLQASIGVAPGNCVEKVGVSAKQVQKCIEETLSSVQKQLSTITESATTHYVNGMRSGANCVKDAEATIQKKIEVVIFQFTSCVKEISSEETAIDALNEQIAQLKTNVQKLSTDWSILLEDAQRNLNNKVQKATTEIQSHLAKIQEEKAANGDGSLSSIKLDLISLNSCSVSEDLEELSKQMTILVRIESSIAASTGFCSGQKDTVACLQKSVESAEIQIERITAQLSELYVNGLKTGTECINNVTQEILSAIDSSEDSKKINALNEQLTQLKTNVQKFSADWSVLLEEAQRNLDNKVQKATSDIKSHLTKIQEEKAANGDGSFSAIKLNLNNLNACAVSEDLQTLSNQVSILVRIESSIAASLGFCLGQKDTVACLEKSVESAEIQIERITAQLSELYVSGLKTGAECVNNVKQDILSVIDSSEDSKTINALNEQLTQLKTNVQELSTDWSVLLEEAQRNLDNKVQKAASDIQSHLAKIQEEKAANGDGSLSAIKLNLNNLNACAVSEDLQSLSNQMTILIRIESSIAASSGFCSGQKETVTCLEKSVDSAEIQIERIIAQLSELYVSGLKTGSECVNNAKQQILSAIDSSEESKNINALNEKLTQLKSNVQELSADWSILLEDAQRNLNNKVQQATFDIQSYLTQIQEEKAANSDGSLSIIKLDFKNLNSCAVSEDLQALSKQMSLLVRIESTIASSSGFCTAQKDTVTCLEKSVDNAENQIETIISQLTELYVSGLKTGAECVNNVKQQLLSIIQLIH